MSRVADSGWTDALFDRSIDLQNRRLFLFRDIEDDSASDFVKGLYVLNSLDPKLPIEIFISSAGGNLLSCFQMVDAIDSITNPIVTVGMGSVMSCAPLLLAAGSKGHRYVTSNVTVMMHAGTVTIDGEQRTDSMKADLSFLQGLEDRFNRLMVKYTGQKEIVFKRIARRVADSYYTAEQAVELGIADHLWHERSE